MISHDADRQFECLLAIRNHCRSYSESPTCSELGRALRISKVSAHLLATKLRHQGLIMGPKLWPTVQGWRVGQDYFSMHAQRKRLLSITARYLGGSQ